MAAQNDCIPVMLAAAEEPMTEVQENMWVTYAKAARSAPANAAHTPIEAHLNRRLHRLEYAAHNSLLTGNLTGNFKFLAAGAKIMVSESRMMRTLVWPQILRSRDCPTTKTITLANNAPVLRTTALQPKLTA